MTASPRNLVLPDNIGFHVRVTQMHIFREFYRAFDGTGMTPGSHTILAMVRDNPGVRQQPLAEALLVSASNITTMIAGLDEAGLVSRTVDESDRRATRLNLTPLGQQVLEAVQGRLDALEQKLLHNLDRQQRKALRDYLDRILGRLF